MLWGSYNRIERVHYAGAGQNVQWFDVPDTREGWAEAVELLEVMNYQKV